MLLQAQRKGVFSTGFCHFGRDRTDYFADQQLIRIAYSSRASGWFDASFCDNKDVTSCVGGPFPCALQELQKMVQLGAIGVVAGFLDLISERYSATTVNNCERLDVGVNPAAGPDGSAHKALRAVA
jgi:hypothetical protein